MILWLDHVKLLHRARFNSICRGVRARKILRLCWIEHICVSSKHSGVSRRLRTTNGRLWNNIFGAQLSQLRTASNLHDVFLRTILATVQLAWLPFILLLRWYLVLATLLVWMVNFGQQFNFLGGFDLFGCPRLDTREWVEGHGETFDLSCFNLFKVYLFVLQEFALWWTYHEVLRWTPLFNNVR
jgi:hypothetical protein